MTLPPSFQQPIPTRPHDLPDFRLWLQQQWQPGNLYWTLAQLTARDRAIPGLPAVTADGRSRDEFDDEHFVHIEATFDDGALRTAPLYWVSTEMATLIATASKTLPPTTLTPELMPAATGLVWFETPLHGLSAMDIVEGREDHHSLEVPCIVWGKSWIPPGPHPALGIGTYLMHENLLSPAGRTDWELGADTEEPISKLLEGDDQRIESMAEDRRWLATFWLLLSQGGVADLSDIRPMRQQRRRIERAMPGIDQTLLDVRVVNVHRPKTASEPTGEARTIDWQQRWIVSPHWRQQAYGPNHSLRRPTLIGPYVKGPADKPLVLKEQVNVLRDGVDPGRPL